MFPAGVLQPLHTTIGATHISMKVKLGIKVMKLVESLIGQGSECHLTFVRGRLHIAE